MVTAPVEVLVLDNGSTDETAAVGRDAVKRYPWLRFQSHPVNLGNDANGLRLLELARGEWCWFLGDDEPVAWGELPALLAVLEKESADVVRLPGPGARLPPGAARAFASVEELVRGYYDLVDFQEASGTLLRTAAARPHLRAAYRFAGRLHTLTPLQLEMLRAGGRLAVHELPLLRPREKKKPRWPQLEAHLGAWETMRECVPPELRPAVDQFHTRKRWREIVAAARAGASGEGPPLDDLQLRRVLRLLPVRKWRHLAGVLWRRATRGRAAAEHADTGY